MGFEKSPQYKNFGAEFQSEVKNTLSEQQKSAFILSLKVGEKIQNDFPNIAIDYVNGATLSEIVKNYRIDEQYGVTKKIAKGAVLIALKGFSPKPNSKTTAEFSGLIKDQEILRKIGQKHITDSGTKHGQHQRDQKKGIFSITPAERQEIGRKSGKALYENRQGVHGKSPQERLEYVRRAILARGARLLSEEEKNLIVRLSAKPEYRNSTGSKINAEKIAATINSQILNEGGQILKGIQITKFLQDRKRIKK